MNTVTKHQRFEAVQIRRGEIKNAPYNPREITPLARKQLKKSLEGFGLVETLVWNRRTGNLVGGHQRLSVLDDLEGGTDYGLTVAAIDVDEKAERKINVMLNNSNAQGAWDSGKLAEVVKSLEGDLQGLGFDKIDLEVLCGDELSLTGLFDEEKDKGKGAADTLESMKDRRADALEKNKKKDDAEFYFCAVFDDRDQVDAFLRGVGLSTESRYISGKVLAERCGVTLPQPEPAGATEKRDGDGAAENPADRPEKPTAGAHLDAAGESDAADNPTTVPPVGQRDVRERHSK